MLAALQLLNMGGGQADITVDSRNTLFVPFEQNTLFVQRGFYDMLTVYIDKDSDAKLVKIDWSDWLNGSSIASTTWEVQNSSNRITVSNTSNNSTICTAYLNATYYNDEIFVKNTIVTNDTIPETESRSILVKTVRTV